MSNTNFDELLNAGCHFGHLTRKWNPKMAPYIFMERNDIHIIDLNKTAIMLDKASAALKQIAKSGRKILFVATKKPVLELLQDRRGEGAADVVRVVIADALHPRSHALSALELRALRVHTQTPAVLRQRQEQL